MMQHKQPIRVRFAPSPTGHLHLGSLRTALFNWLFARHTGGTYIVRVEDTDRERSLPHYMASIRETLAWCQLESDEPLTYQSERGAEYAQYADALLVSKAAYRCYCTQEEVRDRVRNVTAEGVDYFVYDGRCRDRTDMPDKPFVIRVRVPRDREAISVNDLIHGTLEFPLSAIDDFVIVRSDGSAMYNFTVVVDDHLMGITHVIRGDDHIINTPRQMLLYEAAQFSIPLFAHIPLILGKDGTKLSKRDASTAVIDYRTNGILAEALCNYLVRLGWAHGNREVIHRDELIQLFSLEQVGKKGAIFDHDKLFWLNGVYLKEKSAEQLLDAILKDVDPLFRERCVRWNNEQVAAALRLYQGRSKTLVELKDAVVALAAGTHQVMRTEQDLSAAQHSALFKLVSWLHRADQASVTEVKAEVTRLSEEEKISFAECAMPIRYALTGSTAAPSVAELIIVLGPQESARRLELLLNC